jgi:hypothetical protein
MASLRSSRAVNRLVPNPWDGMTRKRRVKNTKAAVNRDQVYAFAWGCIERGQPEAAAAAVICLSAALDRARLTIGRGGGPGKA